MKNVLFTTTAIAALAVSSVAFADAHQSSAVGISGSAVVGYNDEVEGGLFLENDIDLKVNHEVAPGYGFKASFGVDAEVSEAGKTSADSNGDTTSKNNNDVVSFDGASLSTPAGTLSFDDDIDEATAAWEFFDDTDGMTTANMPTADNDSGIKWVGEFGDFGYAVSTGADDGDSDIPGDAIAFGLGGTFGDASVGLGYDDSSETLGISGKMAFGDFDVHLGFQDSTAGSSVGAKVSGEFGPAKVGVYFATNDTVPDEYGLFLDFALADANVSIDFHDGSDNFNTNFEIDVDYAVNDMVTLYAGYDDVAGNYDGGTGAFYAGAEVGVADNITATIAYAEADEIGGPEFKGGTSLYLTIKY